MKKFILPLAAGFALGLSGAAMAGNVGSGHGKLAAQDHSIVATGSGPQLLTDSQMDQVIAGNLGSYYYNNPVAGSGLWVTPSHNGVGVGYIVPCISAGGFAGTAPQAPYTNFSQC